MNVRRKNCSAMKSNKFDALLNDLTFVTYVLMLDKENVHLILNCRWHIHSVRLNLISILQRICPKQLCVMRKGCLCCVLLYYESNSSHKSFTCDLTVTRMSQLGVAIQDLLSLYSKSSSQTPYIFHFTDRSLEKFVRGSHRGHRVLGRREKQEKMVKYWCLYCRKWIDQGRKENIVTEASVDQAWQMHQNNCKLDCKLMCVCCTMDALCIHNLSKCEYQSSAFWIQRWASCTSSLFFSSRLLHRNKKSQCSWEIVL